MTKQEIKQIKKLVRKYEEASEDFDIAFVMSAAFQFGLETMIDYKIGEKEKTPEFSQKIKSVFEDFVGSIVSLCDEFVSEDESDEDEEKDDKLEEVTPAFKKLEAVVAIMNSLKPESKNASNDLIEALKALSKLAEK